MIDMTEVVLAVDFDGTCVEHMYPEIGPDVPLAVEVLKWIQDRGGKIILYTMRSGENLDAAVKWFEKRSVKLYGVNSNPSQSAWTQSPKAYAQVYIDDAALGCPLIPAHSSPRMMVSWAAVRGLLGNKFQVRK